MMHRKTYLLAALLLGAVTLNAQFTTTPEQVKEHVEYLASDQLLGRGFGTPQGMEAASYIAEQFEAAGIEPIGESYLHPFISRKGILNIPGNNVVGVVYGKDPELKDEYIVLGAHYDHIGWKINDGDTVVYNGADDNATGTSAIIEIGKNLVAKQGQLKRSVILVAFDGEESGLLGSKKFLHMETVPSHQVKLMFSMDMVGMVEKHKGLDLKGVGLLKDSDFLVGELAEKYGLKITKAGNSIEQRTDTAPFGKIGIPSVAVSSGVESPYHKPEDTSEKLDYEGMAEVTNFMSDATLFLSNTEEISSLEGIAEGEIAGKEKDLFQAGLRINVGSGKHLYQDQFYNGKDILTTSAGVFANIRLASFLWLAPEVLYETKGSKHVDGVFRAHSITTPLNLQIGAPEEYFRSYVFVGGYYSYHFGGSIGGTPIDFENDYENQEFGLSFGFAMEVMKKVQVGLCFQRGLTDINLQPENKMTHNNVYFTLGFVF